MIDMSNDSKQMNTQMLSGMFWKFAERILAQGTSFIVSIILARLMMPEDYGIVAIVLVFLNIANVFVADGFSQALIQKKGANETDFSTVFYCSFGVACVLYVILFVTAPWIAAFYDNELLIPVLRVFSLRVLMVAYDSVQHAYIAKNMMFKRFFLSTLLGTVISGVVGIIMAYHGFGVWALVAQYLVNSAVDILVLSVTVHWRPRLLFSVRAAKELMGFGWKVLAVNLVGTVYSNLRSLLIGKFYTEADLAYYNKGKHFPDLLMNNVASSITAVLFPALSKHNDDLAVVRKYTQKSIRVTAYIVFPLMVGMIAVAKPMILVLLTDKWIDCVFYTQMVCLYSIMHTITQTNLQAINAVGRSDIVLKLEFIKKPVSLILMLAALPMGTKAIAISLPVSSLFTMIVNMYPASKLLGYSVREQIRDLLPPLILSLVMALLIAPIQQLQIPMLLILVLQVLAGILIYIALSIISRNEVFFYLWNMVRKVLRKLPK